MKMEAKQLNTQAKHSTMTTGGGQEEVEVSQVDIE